MAETTISALHTPDTEQTSAEIADIQDQAPSPIAINTALAANSADSTDPDAPAVPAKLAGQPTPEEEELDELIIEDFTIDGICGVY